MQKLKPKDPNAVYCKRCKRRLENPEAIRRGYGPICYVKIHGKSSFKHSKSKDKRENEYWLLDNWMDDTDENKDK